MAVSAEGASAALTRTGTRIARSRRPAAGMIVPGFTAKRDWGMAGFAAGGGGVGAGGGKPAEGGMRGKPLITTGDRPSGGDAAPGSGYRTPAGVTPAGAGGADSGRGGAYPRGSRRGRLGIREHQPPHVIDRQPGEEHGQ